MLFAYLMRSRHNFIFTPFGAIVVHSFIAIVSNDIFALLSFMTKKGEFEWASTATDAYGDANAADADVSSR